jgi:hypothetical protein
MENIKKLYTDATIEMIEFNCDDILTTSGDIQTSMALGDDDTGDDDIKLPGVEWD